MHLKNNMTEQHKILFGWLKESILLFSLISFVSNAIGSEPSVKNSTENLERQLFETRIRSLSPEKDIKSEELKKIIQQVRSVKFESRSAAQISPYSPIEVNAAPALKPEESRQYIKITDSVEQQRLETQELLEKQLKDPNLISNPYELAEILYKNGNQFYAGLCYKQAFSKLPPDDPNLASQRAWILFQIGNCLKDEDPNTAKESYAELIRTHSDSPWAELAKVRYSLIEWYQQEKPELLIQQQNKKSGASK